MRVALLAPLFESVPPRLYGGTERVIANLALGLKKAGVDVTLFASADSQVDVPMIPVVEEALRLHTPPYPDPNIYNFRMLSMVAELGRQFDVIHNHHDYWMLPLANMVNIPLVTTVHGRLDRSPVAAVYQGFPGSSFISISNSQREAAPFLNWANTVYHGIPIDGLRFHPGPGSYLAFLGRIFPEKGPEKAIEIAKRSGVPLKIAAKIEGPESQAYFDTYLRPHIDGRFIEYLGEISDAEKSDFLGNALALVFPIGWPEPFGLVLIESLACGTPVLARPMGSVPELLLDGVTGYVDMDVRKLARRVRDIPRIDRLTCRAWVEKRFSIQRMTEDYIDVYRSLTKTGADRNRRHLLYSVQRVADGNS